jgi:VanZ family protein
MALIFFLSSLQGPQLEPAFKFIPSDKFAHFVAFAAGAVLLCRALRSGTRRTDRWILLVTLIAISAFGATDEWHQLYTPLRSGGDFGDWLADTLGATFGVLSLSVHAAFRRTRNQPADRALAPGD